MKEERVHLAYRLPLSMIKERCGKTLPGTRMSELKLELKKTVYYLFSLAFLTTIVIWLRHLLKNNTVQRVLDHLAVIYNQENSCNLVNNKIGAT